MAAANELSPRSTTRWGERKEKKEKHIILPWRSSFNTFSPGPGTGGSGKDVNNGWTGHVATCMDSYAMFKDTALSSDWSCKAISTPSALEEGQLGWMGHIH